VHWRKSLTTGDFDDAATKCVRCQNAAETTVLASAEKMGTASPYVVLPLRDVSGIITEVGVDEALIAHCRKLGIAVTQV
jgi:DeoR/GlpR family transcriptional regulator of sugar metabolism